MNIPLKRAAIAQLCSSSNKFRNLGNIAKVAGLAKRHGASMLFIPECFGFVGLNARETLANAEKISFDDNSHQHQNQDVQIESSDNDAAEKSGWIQILREKVTIYSTKHNDYDNDNVIINYDDVDDDDDTILPNYSNDDQVIQPNYSNDDVSILTGICAIAKQSGLWISGGGMHEAGAPPPLSSSSSSNEDASLLKSRVYNTHVIVDNEGNLVTKYRKIHLFDVSIPSQGVNLQESATTAPGNKLVLCDSPLGKLGLATCYDVRFPEMFTKLREGGADILLVPSAFTVPTGRAHWHTLLRGKTRYLSFEKITRAS